MHRLVAAARFEIQQQPKVRREHVNREQGHLAQRAELAGRGGRLERVLRGGIGDGGALDRVNRLVGAQQIILFHLHGLVQGGVGRGQLLGGGGFLQIADERRTENADRQHADAANGVQRERAAFGTLFRGQAQNGRPEEGLAHAVEGGGGKDGVHARATGLGQRGEADGGNGGAGGEQADRQRSAAPS